MYLCLLVDEDFTEYGTEQAAPAIGNSPRLDVNITSHHGLDALYMQGGLEEGVVQARYETAHVLRNVHLVLASFAVHVHGQLVQVVHVVSV